MYVREHIPRILYIDAYDSFTSNIIDLLETTLGAWVITGSINDDIKPHEVNNLFDAVVVGPGPGNPVNSQDIGFMNKVWRLKDIPVLGICLGFQSLCHFYNAEIALLPFPRHGRIVNFKHSGDDIFKDLPEFEVTLYHSLQVKIGHPAEVSSDIVTCPELWKPSSKCPDLLPLAWYQGEDHPNQANLMAVRHVTKPFWGVQFHPESCKSDPACRDLIRNWWESVQINNKEKKRQIQRKVFPIMRMTDHKRLSRCELSDIMISWCSDSTNVLSYQTIDCFELTAEKICELVDVPNTQSVVLDAKSRYTIISVVSPGSWTFEYRLSDQLTRLARPSGWKKEQILEGPSSVVRDALWRVLDAKHVRRGNEEVPFWGGFLGFYSYEMGLDEAEIETAKPFDGENTCDVGMLWTERSIVIDRRTKKVHIQSIREDDKFPGGWLDLTANRLVHFSHAKLRSDILLTLAVMCPRPMEDSGYVFRLKHSDDELANLMVKNANITMPKERQYKRKIAACQAHIRKGNSYELCLTAQTKVTLPPCKTKQETNLRPWILYRRLRKYNPASFSAYARIGNAKVISSSPESFMHWDRKGNFSMKPMKGTVKKGPGMTLEKATEILNTPKEMGENLMIADLVRHDLTAVLGSGGVKVHKLLKVEEHARVYQLITHIKGQRQSIPYPIRNEGYDLKDDFCPHTAFAMTHCLPPGSMTGAPKKRSCEILTRLEKQRRGLYSGVMGYYDVGGGASFSVLIRTAFSWSEDKENQQVWRIGAGGAITALSTPQDEWDEMVTKLDTVLAIFRPTPFEQSRRPSTNISYSPNFQAMRGEQPRSESCRELY